MSTLGQYALGKTLGSGFSAKVKLGTAPDGSQVAIKIFRLDNPNFSKKAFQLLRDEVQSVQTLEHKHVVRYAEFNENAVMTKKNGDQVPVAYLVQELVPGGELFDYVANTGPFKEQIVRYYAKQLIQAVHYIHTKGFAHRDMKCENILLDANYDIKIVDFGFACPVEGRDGAGINRSYVGSLGFMAPEIHAKQAYQAPVVDLFALGVILFILYAGHPPFNCATADDPHYKLIATNRTAQFWQAHENRKPEGFFNEAFKDLVTTMLNFHPHHRLSIPDIVAHPWLQKGDFSTAEEVRSEFKRRHEVNKEITRQESERKQAMKAHVQNQPRRGAIGGGKKYRWVEDPELTEEERQDPNTLLLRLNSFNDDANDTRGFFSNFAPEDILEHLTTKMDEQGQKFAVSDKVWRVKFTSQRKMNIDTDEEQDNDDSDEENKEEEEAAPIVETAEIQVDITKVPNKDILHINFKRKAGAAILFYEKAKYYKEQLALFNNATLEEGEAH